MLVQRVHERVGVPGAGDGGAHVPPREGLRRAEREVIPGDQGPAELERRNERRGRLLGTDGNNYVVVRPYSTVNNAPNSHVPQHDHAV